MTVDLTTLSDSALAAHILHVAPTPAAAGEPAGEVRAALLEAGRRLHNQPGRGMLSALGRIFEPDHALVLTPTEAAALLNGALQPSGSTVERRVKAMGHLLRRGRSIGLLD